MANLFSLQGKNAWVTGAAYGIGFAIAKAFVEAGVENIIFNTSNQASMEKGLEAYKEAGITNVHGYVCDVTDEEAVKELVQKIHAEVGQIDILVNNAGIIKRIPMHEMSRAEFQRVIDVDLVGPYICAAAVVPEMMERREGKIINICSMMSELGRETVILAPVTLLRRRPLRCVSASRMAAVTRSTASSAPKPLPAAGWIPVNWAVPPCSWLRTPRML